MQGETTEFVAPDFLALTIGIVVFFVGVLITQRVEFLRRYSIPEPVTGGFVAALVLWAVHALSRCRHRLRHDDARQAARHLLRDRRGERAAWQLAAGGRVLGILCLVTVAFVFLQDTVGTIGAVALGLPKAAGVVVGSMSLVGGHGTAIAWGPTIAAEHGFPAALESGIAVATISLIIASLLGGPLAKLLIERNGIEVPGTGPRTESCRRRPTRRRSTRWGSCARCSRSTSR